MRKVNEFRQITETFQRRGAKKNIFNPLTALICFKRLKIFGVSLKMEKYQGFGPSILSQLNLDLFL